MNFRTKLAACLVAATLASTGGSASAATVDFTTENGSAPSFSFTDGIIDVVATGFRKDLSRCRTYTQVDVTANSNGLGVTANSGRCFGDFDSEALDGQVDEYMILTLSKAKTVTELMFSEFESPENGGDPYRLFVDDGSGSFTFAGSFNLNPFATPFFAKRILISATDNSSAFRVASMSYVVPLPAAGWMLLAGLGGIAAVKRRRKAA